MLEVVKKEDAFAHDFDLGPLTTVVKRNGEKHPFDASKIVVALTKAGAATAEFGFDDGAGY